MRPMHNPSSHGTNLLPHDSGRTEAMIFWTALLVRLLAIFVACAMLGSPLDLSRDSVQYHVRGIEIAEQYDTGNIRWELWLDHGWYQFFGVVYWILGPHIEWFFVINGLFCAFSGILTYRIGTAVSGDDRVGRYAALISVTFPSVVWYTILPLKESAAMFGILAGVWGIIRIRADRAPAGLFWLCAGLAVIAAVRTYLCIVLSVCAVLSLMPIGTRVSPGRLALTCLAIAVIVYFGVGMLDLNPAEYEFAKYFDVNYINNVRYDMNYSGQGKFSDDRDAVRYGDDWFANAVQGMKGLYFFFMSIDVTNIRRDRQMMAIPEMLFFLICLPYLIIGAWHLWKRSPALALPVLSFSIAIVLVYGLTATNMGAMYRWRVQVLPLLLVVIMAGWFSRKRDYRMQSIGAFHPGHAYASPPRSSSGFPASAGQPFSHQ